MRPHRQIRIDKDSEVTDCCRWCHRGRADHQTRGRKSMLITAGAGQPQKVTVQLQLISVSHIKLTMANQLHKKILH